MNLKKPIKEIELILGYKFKNKNNLINALVHPSYLQEKKNYKIIVNEFERLEFLGDRVLGISISYLIFKKFKLYNEGKLTKKLSYLVQRDFLYKIAIKLKFEKILKYYYKKNSSRVNKSIFADSVEALIGSIFIDGGYVSSFKFIKKVWEPYLDLQESNLQDPKTRLQEISQKKYKVLPEYKLLKKEGPPHYPKFTISLKALNMKSIKASGESIRDAEKNAAKIILDKLSAK